MQKRNACRIIVWHFDINLKGNLELNSAVTCWGGDVAFETLLEAAALLSNE